jgi:hypothetical protein
MAKPQTMVHTQSHLPVTNQTSTTTITSKNTPTTPTEPKPTPPHDDASPSQHDVYPAKLLQKPPTLY